MTKTNSKRKTHSDKFQLTLHKTKQYCKKIRGKIYYFGTDKKQAHQRYLEQAAYLHACKRPKLESAVDQLSSVIRIVASSLEHIYDSHTRTNAVVPIHPSA
jgi:hypothetical protein